MLRDCFFFVIFKRYIYAEYVPEKRTFIIYPDKKEYLKSQITVALNSPHVLEHLIDEMLETNSGRVFSDNDLTFFRSQRTLRA